MAVKALLQRRSIAGVDAVGAPAAAGGTLSFCAEAQPSGVAVADGAVARLPGWAVVLAAACVVGGAVLTVRPFSSVEVLVLLAGINCRDP